MARRVVTVFGGSGFLGRHLVQRLAASGAIVRVAVRDTEDALYLKPLGDVGQIVPVTASVANQASVEAAVDGADAVVNLVGILYEWSKNTFERIHAQGAGTVAAAAKAAGAGKLVHISAIGADPQSDSLYARSKAAGEQAVREAFPEASIFRPSVIFGPEDTFFNLFAGLSRITPFLPVFGCPLIPKITLFQDDNLIDIDFFADGGTKFQPVYVGDVADAIMAALEAPEAQGQTYELGGPQVYSYKQVMELLLENIGRKKILAPYPFGLAAFWAFFLEMWPKPLFTRDQIKLLRKDNVVGSSAKTFRDLGIEPTAAEAILPSYLRRYRPPARQSLREA